jgi:serine/threonine-protein kinase RsbW
MSAIILTIKSSLENTKLVGLTVNKLCSLFFTEEQIWQIELSIVEAITNVIKHSYRNLSDYLVNINLDFTDDSLIITVSDTGVAMTPGFIDKLQAFTEVTIIDELLESGRGLALIKLCMDEVSYSSVNGVNKLILIKRYQVVN